MNVMGAVEREIKDVLFKTPEKISEAQFRYNKMIPTIMIAQKINEQIETLHCQLV